MKSRSEDEFLPLSQIEEYTQQGYYCSAIVFSPETENDHFLGCPPYIRLSKGHRTHLYFRVPDAIAYYGKVHAGYTMEGRKEAAKRGRDEFKAELREMLGIEN